MSAQQVVTTDARSFPKKCKSALRTAWTRMILGSAPVHIDSSARDAIPVSMFGRTYWAFSTADLYQFAHLNGYRRGTFLVYSRGYLLRDVEGLYLYDCGVQPNDTIVVHRIHLQGGSSNVASVLRAFGRFCMFFMFWFASTLVETGEMVPLCSIEEEREILMRRARRWSRKVATRKLMHEKNNRVKRKWAPQNALVSQLEREVTAPRGAVGLSNHEWEQAYQNAVDQHAFYRMEAQSFGLSSLEGMLEVALSHSEKKHISEYAKLAEDVIVMLAMLSRAKTRSDMAGAFAVFAKLRCKDSLALATMRHTLLFGLDWFFHSEAQSGTMDNISVILENYKDFKHSSLAERLHCFMIYALGCSLFDKVGMKIDPVKMKMVADAGRDRAAWKSADFIYLCLESIVFICERGQQAYKLGSLQPLFHSSASHEKWIAAAEKIKVWSTCLGNPEPHGFTVFQYQNELETLIEHGEAIVKVVASEGYREKMAAHKILCELKMLKAGFITTNDASKDRIEPFGALIAGGSSVMKSTFSKILFYHYSKVMGLPASSDYRYVRNYSEEYWSGFKTSKWCIHLDDIAPFKPTAVQGVDPSVSEALQILNTVAYVTNQAELQDKGKVPVRARLVTASTNVIDINAHAYYENDLAPRRRFPVIVKLEMKPEYAGVNGMCDPTKVPVVEGRYHDVWIISMYRVVAAPIDACTGQEVPKQRAKLELVATYDDIDDFLAVFSKLAIRQYEVQQKASTDDKMMAEIEICNVCHRRRCNCYDYLFLQSAYERVPSEVSDSRSEASYQLSEDDEETPACIFHTCIYDKEVILHSRNEGMWNVELLEPTPLQVASGAHIFPAEQQDLYRGEGCLIWCGARLQREREAQAFSPDHFTVRTSDFNAITADYFDVVRERAGRWTPRWFLTYPTHFILSCAVNYKWGRRVATWILCWTIPRRITFWYLAKVCPQKAHAVARLCALRFDKWNKRHPYLVAIGQICAIALATYLATRAVTSHFAKRPVAVTTEEIEAAKDEHGNIRVSAEMLAKLQGTAGWQAQVSVHPPVPHDQEYENMWCDHDTKQVRFSVSDMSASWSGLSWDNIHEKVKWNTACVIFRKKGWLGTERSSTKALCIASRVYLVNKHAFLEDSEITMIFESNSHGVTANITFPTSSIKTYSVPGQDLVAMEVIHAPVRKNLIPLVPLEVFQGRAEGMYLIRHEGDVERVAVSNVRHGGTINVDRVPEQDVYIGRPERETAEGECGSPLFARVSGAVMLLGVHVAGRGPHCAAVVFTKSMMDDIMAQFTFARVNSGAPQLKVGSAQQHVGPVHHKSHTHFEKGTAVVVGGDPTFRPKGASKVSETYIAEAMKAQGFSTDNQAPNLKSWKPFSLGLKDLLNTNKTVDIELLGQCARDYVNEVLPNLPSGWQRDVHFYPLDTAINGADGVAYVDALNKNTSAGAPVNASKRRHLVQDLETGRWGLTSEMAKAVEEISGAYQRKEKANPIFMAHLKDQAIPEKKVKAEKVRVFVGGPMAWTIVVRMRLLWFIRLAQCHRLLFELGAGTVAQSIEWDDIYRYLTAFGRDRIVAGDFRTFDKKMGAAFILHAFWIIVQFAHEAGMDQDAIDEIWCIAEDTAFAFVNYNGDLMMFLGSNPSGHPLTVIVNSLVNSLYMRYVFRQVAPVSEKSRFKFHVHLYTYGDDNIMGVRVGSDWFNHTQIARLLAIIGVEYTMADKESESVPFIDISEASFLKRAWRWEDELQCHVAPLEPSSIVNSLMIGIVSKDMVPQAHSVAVMQSAMTEWFFHGRSVFDEWRQRFEKIIHETKLEPWMDRPLRTWDECKSSFVRASHAYERVRDATNREWLDTSHQGEAKTSADAVTAQQYEE